MTASRTHHDTRIVDQFTRWAKPFAELAIHAEAESMAQTLAACAVTRDMKVLDVACGPGIIACELARVGAEVTGIDLTPAMIEQARLRADRENVRVAYHIGNALHLPFQADSFDRVVTRYSFHHMQDPGKVLTEMVRVCRPGGRIIVIDATPAPECQKDYDRAETLRDPSHTSALTLQQLQSLGTEAGLSPVTIHQYRLESRLQDQVAPENWCALKAMFAEDIAGGQDRLGIGAWEDAEGIHFYFPVSIVAWSKSMLEKSLTCS
ncbi:SAM-dependent methyltransferase [Acetobacter orientalis]|uniref:SAM-dependent methyltransferase n=1 Tax=Acetobacter orientalis TaxID=146474 RepID=A0A252B9K1_9PROT|nr:class I SAM-dependent methyltransferase [Acetobacter orientalis]OUJ00928.1 SAM-dependent methyltransferase [Acetobacter orientalis]